MGGGGIKHSFEKICTSAIETFTCMHARGDELFQMSWQETFKANHKRKKNTRKASFPPLSKIDQVRCYYVKGGR